MSPLSPHAIRAYIRVMLSLSRLFARRPDPRDAVRPLWHAVVATARAPHWYEQGEVADTVDGRFEMVALVMALVLHRLDDFADQAQAGVALTELLVDDMDGQLRQIGFGDLVVGKEMGKLMAALGGRIGAYRPADGSADLADALVRNLWRGTVPSAAAAAHVQAAIARLRAHLAGLSGADLAGAAALPDGQ